MIVKNNDNAKDDDEKCCQIDDLTQLALLLSSITIPDSTEFKGKFPATLNNGRVTHFNL